MGTKYLVKLTKHFLQCNCKFICRFVTSYDIKNVPIRGLPTDDHMLKD